jgi:hypothetical protein
VREYIMPIIESAGVDLVLTGHSHIYERSMLVDGAYSPTNMVSENMVLDDGDGDPSGDGAYRKSAGIHPHEGTVQIVAGNAGQTISRKGTVPLMKRTILEYGSVVVDIDGDTMVGRMVNRSGVVRDLFSVVKRGKVEPIRLALPWQPDEYKKPTNEVKAIDYLVQTALPLDYKILISTNSEWQYLTGEDPRNLDWTRRDFDASKWRLGKAGFGFGDERFHTEVPKTPGQRASIYLRKEFTIEQADKITELGLVVYYSDGFIAYINGREVARKGIGRSSGRNVQRITPQTESGSAYIALKDLQKSLKDGTNLLTIEGHAAAESMDLLLDPYLILED